MRSCVVHSFQTFLPPEKTGLAAIIFFDYPSGLNKQ
jgi:hypothetical protein